MSTPPDLDLPVRWINDDAALRGACDGWAHSDVLAIDTEFVRRKTFYPIPALLQFYDGANVLVVDPIPIEDWRPLRDVMLSAGVVKVFHACSEDLEVFWRLLGVIPAPVFDTQIAAGLCGMRPSMGYNKLVAALCAVELPKDETNSDWLARPLSVNQLQYAAHDVYYLYQIYRQLSAVALEKGRFDWVVQDTATIGASLATLIEPALYYQRLKGAQRLSPMELAVARGLAEWREELARKTDIPRSWVLKDSAIVSLARMQATDSQQLSGVRDLQPSVARKQGARLLEIVAQCVQLPESRWPESLPDTLQPGDKRSLQWVKQRVQACAEELAIAPELLLNRRQLCEITQRLLAGENDLLPPDICNWRQQVLAPVLNNTEHS